MNSRDKGTTELPKSLLDSISERTLLSDGAMGTELQAAGLKPGECGDHWNVAHPNKVEKIQRAYVDAGSDILITNTFGACRLMLARHGYADYVQSINAAAVELARKAFGDNDGYVLGDIGPFGGIMAPLGEVGEQEVRDALIEQAEALVAAGVDGIIVETQTALEEAAIGIEAALGAGAPCVIASFSYDVRLDGTDLATMMGISPEAAAEFTQTSGAHMIGINCGTLVDMGWAIKVTQRYRKHCDLAVMAQPNAGQPVWQGTQLIYKETPEQMASQIPALLESGASIIGACCGSTPEHIAALRQEF
ncbi:MAG: homocysteine S-methyltransferase family protein [Pseudomonadales bacterium]|jgi:5-methyltetrahydrofolate--homocysteine methyltransferase|nr:homocysteine S-methyltransferase family protein [Pseudomonadales bacterium]MDP7360575.1 homocysteine S-methyltransferase family protein [Pseudomonadales bacterium]MDP7594359.1 homocysteine S-methyltransferase family protein [Pseudomonadales bacterium]HJN50518.1 homocysteine S-methyltransferase family protein [Pseudomonadales bacterium]|tara:strand:+ start:1192 stop:2109 length:918 start_codon:yes stop_codon:yes gene_type:complete